MAEFCNYLASSLFETVIPLSVLAYCFKMSEKLCSQWNDFKENATSAFGILREDSDFADVTLACEDGKQVEAHKVILAASSPFFQNLLKRNTHSHPLVYMRGVSSDDLLAMVDFLYFGEASVYQENLESFLAIAQELQLKGLMGSKNGETEAKQKPPKMAAPQKRGNPANKVEENVAKSSGQSLANLDKEIIFNENDAGALALPSNIDENLQELEEQVNSMMTRTEKRNIHGQPIYQCTMCGKEAKNAHLKYHIEAKHLEGVSIPCNHCPNMFRSRSILAAHICKTHRNI